MKPCYNNVLIYVNFQIADDSRQFHIFHACLSEYDDDDSMEVSVDNTSVTFRPKW